MAVDLATLSGGVKAAYLELVASKVAAALGLQAEAVKYFEESYERKLQRARKCDLDAVLASNDDPILAQLVANFKSDDPGLATAFEVYTRRSAAVKADSEATVRELLGLDGAATLAGLAKDAATTLAVAKLAPSCGLDANVASLKEQEFNALVAEWRKVNLNKTLASNDDPILAELLANFKSDDTGLVNAYAVYTQRVNAVKAAAYGEIERAHNWQWIDAGWTEETSLDEKLAAMDGLSRSAYIALVVRRLAVSCGITPEMAQVYEQQYQTRLRAARVADLETTPVTDAIQREVLALVRNTFSGDNALPRDMKTLTDKIDGLKDMARKEVLAAHDWSFAEADFACDAAETEHPDRIFPYHVTLPKGCLLVSACYGEDGKVAQWKLRGREIHAQRRLVRIVYVKDVTDFAAWHPKAYRAFILRLVADVAKCVASDPKDRSFQEQLYRDALEEAKVCDTRSSNAPDEAWGDNEIADTMLNGYTRREYDDPLARD